MAKQEDRIKELEQENKELVAHCKRLTRHINKLDKYAYDHMEGGVLNCCVKKEFFESAITASEKIPQQSLVNLQADAVEKAIIETETESEHEQVLYCLSQDLLDYANQLREQGKE